MSDTSKLPFDKAEVVIERFGGVRPMATALGVPASTVQGWKERGSIPEGRHVEIKRAFAGLGQESDIPVDHAIDAAKDMKDKVAPEPDKETRNYQPPRSKQAQISGPGASAGGSNLILSLILLLLILLVGVVGYQVFFASQSQASRSDLSEVNAQLDALAGEVGQVQDTVAEVQGSVASLTTLDQRISETATEVEEVSGQLVQLAADVEASAEQQAQTISELSVAQTGLFEVLSQELLGQMDTIAANMDQSVTDQIRRLEARANAAIEEARNQEQIARDNEEKARQAEADARVAEAALAEGIQQIAGLIQLRLALASNSGFADGFTMLTDLADTSADLAVAQRALAEYANGPFGETGIPSNLALAGQIDALLASDLQALREAAGLGIFSAPKRDDLTTDQGRLSAAQQALQAGNLTDARGHLSAVEGTTMRDAAAIIVAIDANMAALEAEVALDRWIALKAAS